MVREATGGYHRAVVAAWAAVAWLLVGGNPRPVRAVAQATGPMANTDALAAHVVAHWVEAVHPVPRPLPAAQTAARRARLARRRHLIARRAAEQNRLEHLAKVARTACRRTRLTMLHAMVTHQKPWHVPNVPNAYQVPLINKTVAPLRSRSQPRLMRGVDTPADVQSGGSMC
jgi:hypothetical protein